MITIKLVQSTFKELDRFFQTADKRMENAIRRALHRTGQEAVIVARQLAPIKKGQLRRSIQLRELEKSVIVGTDLKYAAIHEFGGTISARSKPYLHFKVNGGWVRVKSVTIPKYKGRGYMGPAFEEAKKYAKRNFGIEINSFIKSN